MNVTILHQYYCPEHFQALRGRDELRVDFFCIDPFFYIYKAFSGKGRIRESFSMASRAVKNFFSTLFFRNRVIILGLSPYNWLLFLCIPILRKNRVIFFTSWPRWEEKVSSYGPSFLGRYWKTVIRKYCLAVACVNLKSYDYWKKYLPVFLVEHSVSLTDFRQKTEYAITGKFVYVGRAARYKNLSVLRSIVQDNHQLTLDIIGDIPSNRAPADSDVRYLGRKDVSWLRDNLCTYDALVLPSEAYEPFGIVLLEAMAAALPVIVTPTAGTETIFRETPYLYVSRSSDKSELNKTIQAFLSSSDNNRRETGRFLLDLSKRYDPVNGFKKWSQVLSHAVTR